MPDIHTRYGTLELREGQTASSLGCQIGGLVIDDQRVTLDATLTCDGVTNRRYRTYRFTQHVHSATGVAGGPVTDEALLANLDALLDAVHATVRSLRAGSVDEVEEVVIETDHVVRDVQTILAEAGPWPGPAFMAAGGQLVRPAAGDGDDQRVAAILAEHGIAARVYLRRSLVVTVPRLSAEITLDPTSY